MGILKPWPSLRKPGRKILFRLLLILLTTPPLPGHTLAAPPTDENTVKSAYLYQFPKFVVWPRHSFADAATPLVLCILGDDPFGPTLLEFQGRLVQDRPLLVRHYPRVALVEGCHMLYISASERSHLPRIIADLGGRPVLTVSDMAGFADAGGMIALERRGSRIGLKINLEAVRDSGLEISSKLLRLADIVAGGNA